MSKHGIKNIMDKIQIKLNFSGTNLPLFTRTTPNTAVTPVAGSIFGPLSRSSTNLWTNISPDFNSFLIQVLSSKTFCSEEETFSEAQFTNLIPSKRFQRLLFEKGPVKTFQIHGFRFMNSDRYWKSFPTRLLGLGTKHNLDICPFGNKISELSFGKVVQKSIRLPA